jgi:hypothetical protein
VVDGNGASTVMTPPMPNRYIDPEPDSDRGRVRIALMVLHEEHRRDGMLPTSSRFLLYELVTREIVSKDKKYLEQSVSVPLTQLREREFIPWTDIVDETRSVEDYTGSSSVAEDLLRYLPGARLDPWRGNIPFLITESRSLAGVLRLQVQRYRIRIAPTNGQVVRAARDGEERFKSLHRRLIQVEAEIRSLKKGGSR